MGEETKREERNRRYRVVIETIYDAPIKTRSSEYIREKEIYKYGEWYDTFSEKTEKIFDQTISTLDLTNVILAVNNLKRS